MADVNLTQAEADALIALEKCRVNEQLHTFPMGGQSLSLDLESLDKRELFLLDLSRGRIDFAKVKMQNRARQVVVLVRIDLAGSPHRNPDGEEIPCPHIHIYREGFGDKWAMSPPADRFQDTADIWRTLNDFFAYCNITRPPQFQRGLFA